MIDGFHYRGAAARRPGVLMLLLLASSVARAAEPAHSTPAPPTTSAWIDLARSNPSALVDTALARCAADVRDFTCRLTKQERIDGHLNPPADLRVLGRCHPFSVLMCVEGPATNIRRALYVEGERVDEAGRELMLVEPTGFNRLLVSEAEIPIDDPRLVAASRMLIQDFGFSRFLERFASVNRTARQAGDLDLSYGGTAVIDGRPTIMLTRRLPYTAQGRYPAALTVLHLDQEWLIPTALMHYADREGHTLLASYVLSDVRLNRGLDDGAFSF